MLVQCPVWAWPSETQQCLRPTIMSTSPCSLHTIRFAFSYIALFLESLCRPSRNSRHWLTDSIWHPVGYTSFPQSSLPPTPPYSGSFLGPLVLMSLSQLADNFQASSWAKSGRGLSLWPSLCSFRAAVFPPHSEPGKHTTPRPQHTHPLYPYNTLPFLSKKNHQAHQDPGVYKD